VIALCVAAAMVAAGCVGGPSRQRSARLGWVISPGAPQTDESAPLATVATRAAATRLAIATVMVIAGVVAIGGPLGVAVGLVAAVIVAVVRPQRPSPQPNLDDIPVVVDLVAGCLAAGASLADALDAASVAADDVRRPARRLPRT
jgi:Flp pilus assembly protein TadB